MGDPGATRGMDWSKKTLKLSTFREEDERQAKASFFIALCSDSPAEYEITTDCAWIAAEKTKGEVSPKAPLETIVLTVDKALAAGAEGELYIRHAEGCVTISVKAPEVLTAGEAGKPFAEANGLIVIDADHFEHKADAAGAQLKVLSGLGRRESALGLYPVLAHFDAPEDAPYVEYVFETKEDADYTSVFQMLPTNSYKYGTVWKLMYSVDGGEVKSLRAIPDDHLPGESEDWAEGVLSHKRDVTDGLHLGAGVHRLRFYGTDAENVLERILLVRKDRRMPGSYLGPAESKRR